MVRHFHERSAIIVLMGMSYLSVGRKGGKVPAEENPLPVLPSSLLVSPALRKSQGRSSQHTSRVDVYILLSKCVMSSAIGSFHLVPGSIPA
jgi:hypothetical protein